MTAIETEDLTKQYGDLAALDGLSLAVDEGELYALLGPNGSGKTTTIEILTGQREPTGGRATVLGHDPVTDPIAVRREIGILPEREDPPSFLTPREYLEFVGEVRNLDAIDERIDRWADRLAFEGCLDNLSTSLSEGQRQRVMLAAAFVHEPALVFIDEPLVNLDPIMQEQVKRHLADYCADGNTIFLSTHYVDVAAELCTRVGIVTDGRLVAEADPRELGEDELLDFFIDEVDAASDSGGLETASADGGRRDPGAIDRPRDQQS